MGMCGIIFPQLGMDSVSADTKDTISAEMLSSNYKLKEVTSPAQSVCFPRCVCAQQGRVASRVLSWQWGGGRWGTGLWVHPAESCLNCAVVQVLLSRRRNAAQWGNVFTNSEPEALGSTPSTRGGEALVGGENSRVKPGLMLEDSDSNHRCLEAR